MLGEPSRFWRALAATHAADLEEHGFDRVKRRQALRYFTWRWTFDVVRRSEQMRFLLGHTSPLTWLRCAAAPAVLDDAAWAGVSWSRRDRWLYTFAVRLLWEYARRRDPMRVLELPEPEVGGPLPIRWRGRLISQDLANSALETAAIGRALGGRTPGSILEVGAGYGRNAYALLSRFPGARYTIVDIEPALTISRWYLSHFFAEERLRFISPEAATELPDGCCDLVVSISSLHEMTPAQVGGYLSLFDRLAAGGTVYLKQWAQWHNPTDDVTLRFAEYPVPARWQELFREPAPVQSTFTQAAWGVPARPD